MSAKNSEFGGIVLGWLVRDPDNGAAVINSDVHVCDAAEVNVCRCFSRPEFRSCPMAALVDRRLSRRGMLRVASGLAVAATAGCSIGGGAASGSADTIRLGMQATTVGAAAKIAERKGYFAAQGLVPTYSIFAKGPDAAAALQAGSVDVIVLNYVSLINALVNKTADLMVVVDANQATPQSCRLIVDSTAGIAHPRDLEGKKVAIHAERSVNELLVRETMTNAAANPQAVDYRPITFDKTAQAILSGQVSAGVLIEPFLSLALMRGLGVTDPFSIIHGSTDAFPLAAWVTTRDTARHKRGMLEAFQRAMAPAQVDAGNRDEQQKSLPDLLTQLGGGVNKDQISNVMQLLQLDGFPLTADANRLNKVSRVMKAQGWLTQDFDLGPVLLTKDTPRN
ncbi:ABC transporter substrate-binding protein [Kibdelosporangium lantanae]|uniref:ABC transporter substrate-binding protein n=1 Tax=Kibdelosporangium lantanae TaxID=1497396 RepID=A0ABW3M600_9PSEU